MQISKINNQNFGANPCELTKIILTGLEKSNVDTTNIMRMMRGTYVGGIIKTEYPLPAYDLITMNLYSKRGDKAKTLISDLNRFFVSRNDYKIEKPEALARKLYDALNELERKRTPEQRAYDKVHSFFA